MFFHSHIELARFQNRHQTWRWGSRIGWRETKVLLVVLLGLVLCDTFFILWWVTKDSSQHSCGHPLQEKMNACRGSSFFSLISYSRWFFLIDSLQWKESLLFLIKCIASGLRIECWNSIYHVWLQNKSGSIEKWSIIYSDLIWKRSSRPSKIPADTYEIKIGNCARSPVDRIVLLTGKRCLDVI